MTGSGRDAGYRTRVTEETRAVTTLGTGRLTWATGERIGDRYGSVTLMRDGDSLTAPSGFVPLSTARPFEGQRGTLRAKVIETRQSTHIGDFFRGLRPTTPDVGEVIDLGTGTLFHKHEDWAETVGLLPDDGRNTDWLDPRALYRCHEQTVELFFVSDRAAS